MMRKTALITGASTGIGYELSKIFAESGYNLVPVSRNKERLKALANEMEDHHDIIAKVIAKDLSKSSAPQEIYDEVVSNGIDMDVLVNDAGFEKEKKIIIPGLMNKLLAFGVRLAPRSVLVLILRFLNQKK